ncbi:MAG TPA: hypothetical protein VHU83_15765 [Bryobacteraceae bacterium]|nr:hypothetical protein [Bryobacteraceae bacterium]
MSNVSSSNVSSNQDVVSRLASQLDAVGRLAQDSGGFAAVVAAFEAKDANAFRWVLERLEMLPYCELICEWVRIKIGVLRCIEVCGIPRENQTVPNLQQFARAVVELASNETLLRRVVDAVSCGDGDDYRAAIAELKLNDFCQLLCHWVYSTIYRPVCGVVCSPQRVPLPDAVSEIRAAGRQIAGLVDDRKAFDAIAEAALTFNCEILKPTLERANFRPACEIICRLICSWRCVWVCRELCELRTPILTGAYGIEEAQNFALAARQLASQPRALGDLVTAVQNRNAESYAAIVSRFGLGPYCYQVCAWVGAETCHEFCICVCPPAAPQPWFTTVGYFNVFTDIDSGTGLTNTSHSNPTLEFGGGPNFAFMQQLQLGGLCPYDSPVDGTPMKYRFLYDTGSGPNAITGAFVSPVEAGQRLLLWPSEAGGKFALPWISFPQSVYIQAAPTPADPPTPVIGAPYSSPPSIHYINPDANGWVAVDPNALGGVFTTLLGFDTTQVVPGGGVTAKDGDGLFTPLPVGTPGTGAPGPSGVPAGTAVSAAQQKAGTDVSITFEATRTSTFPPGTTADYTQAPVKLHVNNWDEVTELNFAEFATSCCSPIADSLSVQFTVDHEEMSVGGWSLEIDSCSPSAPGVITPTASSPGPPPVTVASRGGWGTIVEDTTNWDNCSYQVWLKTRPGLTTGIVDRGVLDNLLTFCICGH